MKGAKHIRNSHVMSDHMSGGHVSGGVGGGNTGGSHTASGGTGGGQTSSGSGSASAATTSSSSANHNHHKSHPQQHYKNSADAIDDFDYPFCDDVSKYEKLTKIGQGTFGEVFKAKHRQTRKIVALKKVLMENEKEGFPITALREIKILQLLKHDNVVPLYEICRTQSRSDQTSSGTSAAGGSAAATAGPPKYKATFYLVFEFCEHDLAGLLSNVNVKFSMGEIKKVMQQLLNALFFIHSQKILHRDMKAANILITKNGVLKLADFGLARAISSGNTTKRYTHKVVTLWCRPPELLLGECNYGSPVDLWGAGCIMAEMWTRNPIIAGITDQMQLNLISQLCGSITPDVWPGVQRLDLYNKMVLAKNQRRKCPLALDLLDKLLILDPQKRLDSYLAIDHQFLWLHPVPQDMSHMLSQHKRSTFAHRPRPIRTKSCTNKTVLKVIHDSKEFASDYSETINVRLMVLPTAIYFGCDITTRTAGRVLVTAGTVAIDFMIGGQTKVAKTN
ncbi:unnamed protein product [Medioppia subpectinata]|uniref:Protein kinase domain-containing protein n=1 Tax=Medioppia subpectinata TaxID=1979941 RepID=A0A7R9KVS5_9ACAR|nr:unnamed protein product [Medioppia subpectinata]CAG2110774.1 unnamed protein product [Medioppia subpectinata]